ncbi:MAG TPA: response regulator, partial [Bryobacteraceae bacterium]
YQTSEAADGASALALLRQGVDGGGPFSVALIAKDMPKEDGEEVARQIAGDPRHQGVAIILMTPFGERTPAARVEAAASITWVSKPIIEGRLREAFTEALGRDRVPEHAAAPAAPATPHVRLGDRHIRILLAEDNKVNQEVFGAMLAYHGLVADLASTGAEAIRALQKVAYDLVFMDCEMPELDGYEATRSIRNSGTGTLNPRVPIVAVTASAMPGDREKCLQWGMDDYLPKPIEPEELNQILAKFFPEPVSVGNPDEVTTDSPAAAESVFDQAGLLKRMAGNQALAGRVVQGFLEDLPTQLRLLRQQFADGDAVSTRRQAHALKGAAANLSAGRLRAMAFQAEQAAMSGQLAKLAEILPMVEGEAEELQKVLKQTAWKPPASG